jgi:hypothetical protein
MEFHSFHHSGDEKHLPKVKIKPHTSSGPSAKEHLENILAPDPHPLDRHGPARIQIGKIVRRIKQIDNNK